MEVIMDKVFKAQLVISVVGVFINIPHLCILLHPSMRTCSTNSILIGIAIADIIMLSSITHDRVYQFLLNPSKNACVHSLTYHLQMARWIGTFWTDILEQTPLWFGVSLALIRLLIMKFPGRSKTFISPITGYLVVMAITFTTALLTVFFYFKMKQKLIPDNECSGIPPNLDESFLSKANITKNELESAVDLYVFTSGISQISIALLYPLLTIILFLEIRKSTKSATGTVSKKNLSERYRSPRMILVMTVFYIMYSAPSGFCDFIQLFLTDNTGLVKLVEYGSVFVSTLFCLNSMSHSVINFAMSSNYRKTVKGLLNGKSKGAIVVISKSW